MMPAAKARIFLMAVMVSAGAASPALAQKDPLDEVLMSIGIVPRDRDPIDYRERAPLVVPPAGTGLRAPEGTNRGGAWPNDPDIAARKAKANEPRWNGVPASERDFQRGALVGPDVGQRRSARAGVPTVGTSGGNERDVIRAVTPEQMRQLMATANDSNTAPTGVEPQRQYLTEPPKGYRRAAAGAPVRASVEPMAPPNDQVEINVLRPSR
jgi:hypothetical protein